MKKLQPLCMTKLIVLPLFVALVAGPAYAEVVAHCEAILAHIHTESMDQVFYAPDASPVLKALAHIYSQRTGAQQAAIDAALTRAHGLREMSFAIKDEMGAYTKMSDVPINGQIAVFSQADDSRLLQSTGPVLRALRRLDQLAYSNHELTVKTLGLENLPPIAAQTVIDIIATNIYREKALIAPQMADYPFLSVAGVDGAIVTPTRPRPQFFELNLGTPSGMANNIQLLADLERFDPEVWNVIKDYLPIDDTFIKQRKAIESNAEYWTHKKGLIVAMSPGVYNGAHPDVAAQARYSGIPIVRNSDLFRRVSDGQICLRTADGQQIVVTGILGRTQEHFFLQSNKLGIPLVDPNYVDINRDLAAKLKIDLRPGAMYEYKYDKGEIVDVERNDDGSPRLQEIWDKMGFDPDHPEVAPGTFAEAILNRQLYYSSLGGRIVDDKRLFRIVSQYLADPMGVEEVAHPVPGIDSDEVDKFLKNVDQFVVKDPDKSGGAGIRFMAILSPEEKADLVRRVQERPQDFDINYISRLVTVRVADQNSMHAADAVIDSRMFPTLDAQGQVDGGPNTKLVRTAKPGSLFTNTSLGGGYAIGVVLSDHKVEPHDVLPKVEPLPLVTYRQGFKFRVDLINTLLLFNALDLRANEALPKPSAEMTEADQAAATFLTFQLREYLEYLTPEEAAIIPAIRAFSQSPDPGVAEAKELREKLRVFLRAIHDHRTLAAFAPQTDEVFSSQPGFYADYLVKETSPKRSLNQLQEQFEDTLAQAKLLFNAMDGRLAHAPLTGLNVKYFERPTTALAFRLRDYAELMTPEQAEVIAALRAFGENQNPGADEAKELREKLRTFLHDVHDHRTLSAFAPQADKFFAPDPHFYSRFLDNRGTPTERLLAELSGDFEFELIPEEVTYTYPKTAAGKAPAANRFEKVEIATIKRAKKSPKMQEIIDQVEAKGGQVRLMLSRTIEDGKFFSFRHEPAYFWAKEDEKSPSYLIPIIAIDPAQSRRMSALRHEKSHFDDWIERVLNNEANGMPYPEAAEQADRDVMTPERNILGERRAVYAEIDQEIRFPNDPENYSSDPMPPTHPYQPGFTNRTLYPEVVTLRNLIRSGDTKLPVFTQTFNELLDKARAQRDWARTYWADRPTSSEYSFWWKTSLFDLLTKPLSPVTDSPEAKAFKNKFVEICTEKGWPKADCAN